MATGTVKWFNTTKGFGFITPDDGGPDIFVHIAAVERSGLKSLEDGQRVSYDSEQDRRTGKMSAGNLRILPTEKTNENIEMLNEQRCPRCHGQLETYRDDETGEVMVRHSDPASRCHAKVSPEDIPDGPDRMDQKLEESMRRIRQHVLQTVSEVTNNIEQLEDRLIEKMRSKGIDLSEARQVASLMVTRGLPAKQAFKKVISLRENQENFDPNVVWSLEDNGPIMRKIDNINGRNEQGFRGYQEVHWNESCRFLQAALVIIRNRYPGKNYVECIDALYSFIVDHRNFKEITNQANRGKHYVGIMEPSHVPQMESVGLTVLRECKKEIPITMTSLIREVEQKIGYHFE